MTYEQLINIKTNCNSSIKLLEDVIKNSEDSYFKSHFDLSLIGKIVNISNEFYPRTSCGGPYILSNAQFHGPETFSITLIPVNGQGQPSGHSFDICGIKLAEIKITEPKNI